MPILTPEERIGSYVAGRYRLDSILGVGGMGVVYVGTHTWTDRRVAVKILAPEYARNETVVHRFLQEARTAASLRHPSVVDVLDMGEDADGTVFLVLELLEGEPLTDLIEREGPLSPQRTLDLLLPVMRALVAAHRRNIVHRDIKPDNIFVACDESGHVIPKILDFGIAKVIESANSATATGSVIGTPYYMSPEQASGAPDVGPPSDVWSMGVVLYQCLSNHLPFMGPNPTAVLLAIASGDAPPLSAMSSSVPQALAEAVDRALVHDRKVRYQTMGELIDALVEAANASGVTVRARGASRSTAATPAAGTTQAFDPSAPTLTPSNAPAAAAQTTGGERGDGEDDSASHTYADFLARSEQAVRSHRRGVWGAIGATAAAVVAVLIALAVTGEPETAPAPGSADGVAGDPPPVAAEAPGEAVQEGAAPAAGGEAEPGGEDPASGEASPEVSGVAEEAADGDEDPAAADPTEEEKVAEGVELAPWEKRAKAREEAERAERLRKLRERRRRLAAERRRARQKKQAESERSGSLMREW